MDWLKDLIQKAGQFIGNTPIMSLTPFTASVPNIQKLAGEKPITLGDIPRLMTPQGEESLLKEKGGNVNQALTRMFLGPLLQIPYNVKETASGIYDFAKKPSLESAGRTGKGLLGTIQGILTATPAATPFNFGVLPAFKGLTGARAYQREAQEKGIQLKPFEAIVKGGIPSATGEKPIGLGEALTSNKTGQAVGNLLEIPALMMIGGVGKTEAVKRINNVDELATAISKEFKQVGGGGLTDTIKNILGRLTKKGYSLSKDLVSDIEGGKTLTGKNFSLAQEVVFGKPTGRLEVIFDEGFKPLKEAIKGAKGVNLKVNKGGVETQKIGQPVMPEVEVPKVEPQPIKETPLLQGSTELLTPRQAVSVYKKTGEAYPFKNVLKQTDEVIQLPEKSSMLESMVQRKGEIFSADDINPNAKDLSGGFLGNIREATDHVRRMFEGLGEKARKFVVDFHAQKIAEARNFLDEKVKELQKTFDDMKIKGKKQEEFLFDYAEGKIPKEQAPENIVIAGEKLRQFYDDLLNKINEKRALVGVDPIARRENYVTHIFELTNDTKKLMEIDPFSKEVVGDVPFFKFGKRRTAEGGYEKDLVKAIRAYVRAAEYQIAMPEVINRWKIMGEALQKKGLTNFANYVARLTEYIQKGATPMVLKMNEQPLLRNLNQVAEIVSSRISKNLVSQNISASFSNPTQIVTNLAPQVGLDNVVKGFAKTIKEGDDLTSVFIRNRREITQLNEGGIENLLKKIDPFRIMTEFSDRWAYNSALEWALSQGKMLDEAKKIADNMAAKTIGERVFGLVPEYQRASGASRLLTMFTLEPINAIYSFFKDIPQTSKNAFDLATKMGVALVMANLYNHLTERTIGRRFAFDPIDMAVRSIDIWVNKPYTTGEKIEETGKTITRNIPLLDVAFGKGAGFLPVSAPIPTTQELTEDLPMAVAKAGLLLANPYGGGYQIYKTLEGLRAYQKGAVETPRGEIKYLVEKDLDDFLRTTLFGKASIPQAREFYEEKRKPLSPQQSMAVKRLESDEDRQKLYDALMYYRAVNGELSTIKTKISEALYLGKKTPQEIKKMANDLYNQAKKNLAYYTDYYKQKNGVYKRVLDFFAKIIKRDTEETPTAKKETPKTTTLPEFQGVDLSKILGALGGGKTGAGVRLSSKSTPKIKLPEVSWVKGAGKASTKRGGVNLKPVSTTYSRGKEVSKDYTARGTGRGVRIKKG